MFNLMHLVMLYAVICLAVVCVCNSIAIIVIARRQKPRGMTYQDLKRDLKSASAAAKMSENYRKNWSLYD